MSRYIANYTESQASYSYEFRDGWLYVTFPPPWDRVFPSNDRIVMQVPEGKAQFTVVTHGYVQGSMWISQSGSAMVPADTNLEVRSTLADPEVRRESANPYVMGKIFSSEIIGQPAPIENATVTVRGIQASTDSSGSYVIILPDSSPGAWTVTAAGFVTASGAIAPMPTGPSVLDVGLEKIPAPPSIPGRRRLYGTVTSKATGQGVETPRLEFGGVLALGNLYGEYQIWDPPEISGMLNVSAAGYRSTSVGVTSPVRGELQVDVQLEPELITPPVSPGVPGMPAITRDAALAALSQANVTNRDQAVQVLQDKLGLSPQEASNMYADVTGQVSQFDMSVFVDLGLLALGIGGVIAVGRALITKYLAAKVGTSVAEEVASLAAKQSIKDLAVKVITDPKKYGSAIAKLAPEIKQGVVSNLLETEAGRIAVVSMQKELMAAAGTEGLLTSLLGQRMGGWISAPSNLKWLLGAATGLLGTDVFLDFIGEETVQTAGMGVWTAIDNKDWEGAKKALANYRQFINALKAKVELVGPLDPIAYGAFQSYYQAALSQADEYERLISSSVSAEASLTVNSFPSGSDVVVGALISGLTPLTVKPIEPGLYRVSVSRNGYVTQSKDVQVTAGSTETADFYLVKEVPAPTTGEIAVITRPDGADVFINDTLYTYPSNTVVSDLDPGRYVVRVEKSKYSPQTMLVDVQTNMQSRAEFVLSPAAPGEEEVITPVITDKGTLTVETSPGRVNVFLAGEKIGQTSDGGILSAELVQGTYDVTLSLEGFVDRTRTAIIRAGEETKISVAMEMAVESRKLWRVDITAADPSGGSLSAKILVNGSFTGRWTPDYVLLEPGDYVFRLEKSGYDPWEKPLYLGQITV